MNYQDSNANVQLAAHIVVQPYVFNCTSSGIDVPQVFRFAHF